MFWAKFSKICKPMALKIGMQSLGCYPRWYSDLKRASHTSGMAVDFCEASQQARKDIHISNCWLAEDPIPKCSDPFVLLVANRHCIWCIQFSSYWVKRMSLNLLPISSSSKVAIARLYPAFMSTAQTTVKKPKRSVRDITKLCPSQIFWSLLPRSSQLH